MPPAYVGNAVVKELAARGHKVTAFARNIDKVFATNNVTAVAADVTTADFADKLQGFDAVVSAFNPGWNNPNIGTDFAKGAAAITEPPKPPPCLICWSWAAQAASMWRRACN